MSGGNTWVFYHRLGRRLDQCASPVAIRCRTPGIGGGGARFPVPRGVGDPGAAAAAAVTGGWRGGPGRRRRRQLRAQNRRPGSAFGGRLGARPALRAAAAAAPDYGLGLAEASGSSAVRRPLKARPGRQDECGGVRPQLANTHLLGH